MKLIFVVKVFSLFMVYQKERISNYYLVRESFCRWGFNLYISSNENDSRYPARVTSPGNVKGGKIFFRPVFLTYLSSWTDQLSS